VVWILGEITAAGVRDVAWQPGATVEISLADASGQPAGSAHADLVPPNRSFLTLLASIADPGEHAVRVLARPAGAFGIPVTETVRLNVARPVANGAACIGTAALFRRGPFSGPSFVPTADPRFRRQERVRLDVPVLGTIDRVTALVLDRAGHPLPVPMTTAERQEGQARWLTAEAALAPLAPGEYVLQLELAAGSERQKVLKAIRVVS
jgi:hypothetical protein